MTIKEETLHSNIETVNSKQLAVLKKHFPQCFDKNGHFIQEKMLEVVNANKIELSKESYTLNWLGKSYARLLTNLPPKTLLNEDLEHNQLEQNRNSKNLLIKGDNLEVLKHMVNAYSEKVKMIYIDPPYNTGSDGFIYNDDRKFTKQQLVELAGIDLEEAERILEFTDKGSRSHSAWLTFMYPRLYIARELLKDDGVIFISIDDNEVSQLRLICDEIFGESNFVSNIVWQKKYSVSNDDPSIAAMHDHILAYRKSADFKRKLLPRTEKQLSRYKNADNDPRGIWTSGEYVSSKTKEERPTLWYPIIHPLDGKEVWPDGNAVWRYSKDKHEQIVKENRLFWGKDLTYTKPRLKRFLHEIQDGTVPNTWWTFESAGHNDEAQKETAELVGKKVFSTPKPTRLIERMLEISVEENDLVVDFFAGSGSTAHSTLNFSILKKNIKFISIQLPEVTGVKTEAFKVGYETIFDITKARITKAAEKIREENPGFQGDLGFKIFETVEDFRIEDDDKDKELSLMTMTMFDDVMLTDEQYHTLLTTWRLYDGSELTTPVQDIDLDNYTAHLCDNRLYLIASDFSSTALKALLMKLDTDKEFSPNKIVFFSKNFDSVKQMELNEALKSYANKKSLEIDLVGRN
ncbi:site-specific DNA-methyltransferase [Shewanella baltica]|uniref:site-specific DNA-methyltransferase n=1 Tax=Shewanella baltica TaxID=62322 RepID=UPI003D7AC76F